MGLTNNDIFKKLRVAHKLRDVEIVEICKLVDFKRINNTFKRAYQKKMILIIYLLITRYYFLSIEYFPGPSKKMIKNPIKYSRANSFL